MKQRTCNIIRCCKGSCKLPTRKSDKPEDAIAAYMSKECACPITTYTPSLIQNILYEALFDYINEARNPGFELRQLLKPDIMKDPTMTERVITMFSLTQVMDKDGYINGFTEKLITQSRKDLGEI